MSTRVRSFERGRIETPPAMEAEQPTRPVEIIDPARRDRGVLVESVGLFAGRPHCVAVEVSTIGRSPECTVRIDDEALSRLHARIVCAGREYVLEDMASLNGCFVGDRRIARAVLRDGDRIRLGPHTGMRFHLVAEDEERALVRLYEASNHDPLTGLPNRKRLDEQLNAELSFARRHGTELSILLVDIDRFKSVNDTHGHLVGDAVLRHVAQILASTVRAEDLVTRFGGEEFVVVARSTSVNGGQLLAERLRAALERLPFLVEGTALRVTASFGVASIACSGEASATALVARADARLYAAKHLGRNRVVCEG